VDDICGAQGEPERKKHCERKLAEVVCAKIISKTGYYNLQNPVQK
jgi:hypothetical protein